MQKAAKRRVPARGAPDWTAEECERLRRIMTGPVLCYHEIAAHFPGRSAKSINTRAYLLGISCDPERSLEMRRRAARLTRAKAREVKPAPVRKTRRCRYCLKPFSAEAHEWTCRACKQTEGYQIAAQVDAMWHGNV